jgi:mono/diheme cytochrome c family protein
MKPVLLLVVGGLALTLGIATPHGAYASNLAAAKQTYKNFCARCHGENGNGNGPSAATLDPKPRDFADCGRMSKIPNSELAAVITHGGGAAHLSEEMPPWGAVLNAHQVEGLIEYIRTFCKQKK